MNPQTTNGGLDFFFFFGRLRHDCLISSVFSPFLFCLLFVLFCFFCKPKKHSAPPTGALDL